MLCEGEKECQFISFFVRIQERGGTRVVDILDQIVVPALDEFLNEECSVYGPDL